MNHEREGKIQRYKEKKALEAKLKELKSSVDHPSCDDDVARDFYLSTIRKFALTALDEMESLKQEVEILRHIASMPKCGAEAPRPQKSRSVLNNLKILFKQSSKYSWWGTRGRSKSHCMEKYFVQAFQTEPLFELERALL